MRKKREVKSGEYLPNCSTRYLSSRLLDFLAGVYWRILTSLPISFLNSVIRTGIAILFVMLFWFKRQECPLETTQMWRVWFVMGESGLSQTTSQRKFYPSSREPVIAHKEMESETTGRAGLQRKEKVSPAMKTPDYSALVFNWPRVYVSGRFLGFSWMTFSSFYFSKQLSSYILDCS